MNRAGKKKMRISQAGMWNNPDCRLPRGGNNKGFTLMELTVVIFLAGLLLSITVPNIRDTLLHDNLKTFSRKIITTVNYLRTRSVNEYRAHFLLFDLESGKYWYEREGMSDSELIDVRKRANIIPGDVRITDIELYDLEKISEGKIRIMFSRKGYAHYSLLHLSDSDDRKFTIVIEPFIARTKILEDHLNFEDIESMETP